MGFIYQEKEVNRVKKFAENASSVIGKIQCMDVA